MHQDGLTSEFSICLTLGNKTTQDVDAIRHAMPASPYRDDTPHVTLLRTIKTSSPMSDAALLQDIERLLEISQNVSFTVTVHKPVNRFSPLFGVSSLVLLYASREMKSYRKNMIKILRAHNYSVGLVERLAFLPHISVRLGVPYTERTKAMAERSLSPRSNLTLSSWIVLRDIKKDGKYLVKEIATAQSIGG